MQYRWRLRPCGTAEYGWYNLSSSGVFSDILWGFLQVPEKAALPPKPTVPASSGSSGASLQQVGASLRPHSPSVDAKGKNEQGTGTLEELRAQLRELRGTVELMKSQHKYEWGVVGLKDVPKDVM